MDKEKVNELVAWLYKELERTSAEMKSAREKRHYTTEAHNEGKADAILRIIKKLRSE